MLDRNAEQHLRERDATRDYETCFSLETGRISSTRAAVKAVDCYREDGAALLTACRDAAGWSEPVMVSVRISQRQLVGGSLPAQVAAAVSEANLAPELLQVAVTEAMLYELRADTLLTLSAIRDLGVGLALEEFGSGFAGLACLTWLPLTAVTLDRSLVRGLPRDGRAADLVHAITAACRTLGVVVAADGIATERQRALLVECGCDEGMGRLFSPRPSATHLAALVHQQTLMPFAFTYSEYSDV